MCARILGPLAFLLVATACSGDVEVREIDPHVDHGDPTEYVPIGEPRVEVGFYVEQLYAPLSSGEDCPIVHGLQGGTWVMPAVRIQGIASPATVIATLTMADGEELGRVVSEERFFLATDDWLEIQALPVPANRGAPNETAPLSEVFGQPGSVEFSVTDGTDRSSSTLVDIVFVEG